MWILEQTSNIILGEAAERTAWQAREPQALPHTMQQRSTDRASPVLAISYLGTARFPHLHTRPSRCPTNSHFPRGRAPLRQGRARGREWECFPQPPALFGGRARDVGSPRSPPPGSHLLGCSLCLTSRYFRVAMNDWAWKPRAVPATTGVWQMALSVPIVTTLLLRGVPTWPALSTALAMQRTWKRRLK